jgi:hypothetical protein
MFIFKIVKAVVMHEAALKAQAKKMNVESLRAGDQSGDSVEFKIAKVITNQKAAMSFEMFHHCSEPQTLQLTQLRWPPSFPLS